MGPHRPEDLGRNGHSPSITGDAAKRYFFGFSVTPLAL